MNLFHPPTCGRSFTLAISWAVIVLSGCTGGDHPAQLQPKALDSLDDLILAIESSNPELLTDAAVGYKNEIRYSDDRVAVVLRRVGYLSDYHGVPSLPYKVPGWIAVIANDRVAFAEECPIDPAYDPQMLSSYSDGVFIGITYANRIDTDENRALYSVFNMAGGVISEVYSCEVAAIEIVPGTEIVRHMPCLTTSPSGAPMVIDYTSTTGTNAPSEPKLSVRRAYIWNSKSREFRPLISGEAGK